MATVRLTEFSANLARARDLIGLGQGLAALTNGLVPGDELYRSSVVQSVSALDRYVHGVVLDRGVQLLLGAIGPFQAAGRGTLTLSAAADVVVAQTQADKELAARQAIAATLAKTVFQRAEDIASGVAGVGISGVWNAMFGTDAGDAKVALNTIVDRRNQIVHTCDLDPTALNTLTPIADTYAIEASQVVELVAQFMDTLL